MSLEDLTAMLNGVKPVGEWIDDCKRAKKPDVRVIPQRHLTITIAVTERPFFVELLQDLEEAYKARLPEPFLKDITLYLQCEPNSPNIARAQEITWMRTNVVVNSRVLGVRENPRRVIQRAFDDGSTLNLHMDDDARISVNLLHYFYFLSENLDLFKTVVLANAFVFPNEPPGDSLTFYDKVTTLTKTVGDFTSLVWFTTANQWNTYIAPVMKPGQPERWDTTLQTKLKQDNMPVLIPLYPHCSHRGVQPSTFVSPQTTIDQYAWIPLFDGDPLFLKPFSTEGFAQTDSFYTNIRYNLRQSRIGNLRTLSLDGNSFLQNNEFSLQHLQDAYTIMFWLKPAPVDVSATLIRAGQTVCWDFQLDAGSSLIKHVAFGGEWQTRYREDAWIHMSLVRNGSSVVIYENEVPLINNNPLVLGESPRVDTELIIGDGFSGFIDDIVMYDVALPISAISAMRQFSDYYLAQPPDRMPVVYYKLDDNFEDYSPNAYHCVPYGNPSFIQENDVISEIIRDYLL